MSTIISIVNKLIHPEAHSLKIQSMRAAAWSVLQKGTGDALRMAGSLILTRVLFPEAFGLMATVTTVLIMINLFADTGVPISIIQNPHGAEPEFLNSAWIISVCRGIILFIIIAMAAWPISIYYQASELKPLFIIMAANPLILGFENPAIALVVKFFRIEKKALLEIAIQLSGLIVSVILAYILKSALALAYGALFASLVRVIGSYIVQPYYPRFVWHKTYGQELFRFGKYVFLNTIITWFAMNADVLIVGKMLGMETLGVYQIGRNLGMVVSQFFLVVFSQAYMPAVSSVRNDISRIIGMYQRICAFTLALIIPASLSVAFFSQGIIGLLYDPRYQNASVVMCFVCLSGIVSVLSSAASNTFFAMGCPMCQTMSSAVGFVAVFLLVPLGIRFFQMPGAVFAMVCVILSIMIAQNVYLVTGLKFPLKTVLKPWCQVVLTASSVSMAFFLLRSLIGMEGIQYLPLILLTIVVGGGLSLGIYFLIEGPHPFRDRRRVEMRFL
ncbi:MAG: oligosaccharide flippase family protein [Syntrophaceae bacterium]|nr:oligosaccharide flippase family protein [Syntrophaceae bacterium]